MASSGSGTGTPITVAQSGPGGLVVAPTEEPVTLDDAKDHLRIDGAEEDALIMGYITAARLYCEGVARRAFVTQTRELALECWPRGGYIRLPYPPLQSVTSITYTDSSGQNHTVPADDYAVDTYAQPGRVVLGYGKSWPTATLRPGSSLIVRFVAGYGGAPVVPQTYKQAILLLVGHYYENREGVVLQTGLVQGAITPLAVDSLLMFDRGDW